MPSYIVGETELEASKEGRSLTDFKYACVGYSVFLNKKDSSSDQQIKRAELPVCVGLEVLYLYLLPFVFPMNNSISHFTFKFEDNGVYILGSQPCSKFFRSIYSFLHFSQNSCKMRVCYCY